MKNNNPSYNYVTFLEPYTGYRAPTLFKCTACDHEWRTTPQVISQSNKKYDMNGCPVCKQKRVDTVNAEKRAAFLARCPEHIEILSTYDGRQSKNDSTTVMDHVHFRNKNCGHDFWTVPIDVIRGRVDCPVCGAKERLNKLLKRNAKAKVDANHDDWSAYKAIAEVHP